MIKDNFLYLNNFLIHIIYIKNKSLKIRKKIFFKKIKKMKTSLFFILLFLILNKSNQHSSHIKEEEIKPNKFELFIYEKIKSYPKLKQAYIGAFIISSAPIPIFIIIAIFNINNIKILDIMSAFAAGALIGDVFIHNLPEISHYHKHNHQNNHIKKNINSIIHDLFNKNELLLCFGILVLFITEKIMNYFNSKIENNENKLEKEHEKNNNNSHKNENHSHNHSHNHSSNITISLLGDFIHNITDGMAIGAGFNKNLKLGITLSTSIFFHEIPHEIGDFSYLLKQNMNLSSAILSQLITAIGAFFGVYISFLFGEIYSEKIISFASGAFLYLAINTIMGDLKHSKSFLNIFFEGIAFIFGVYVLDALI